MPYSINDVKNLPSNVKKLPRHKQIEWVKIWNSVYERTNDETRAFKEANAIAGKAELVYYLEEDEDE